MYIVISENDRTGAIEIRRKNDLESALEYMEERASKKCTCTLTKCIPTEVEMIAKVKIKAEE